MVKYIAFVCGHNAGRSQMAQAIFNTLKKLVPKVDKEFEAISWGTGIKENGEVNSKIIEPLKEIGIYMLKKDIYFPKTIDHPHIKEKLPLVAHAFTMGCMDKVCELPSEMSITSTDVIDWQLDDPAKEETDVLKVRNDILGHILELIEQLK